MAAPGVSVLDASAFDDIAVSTLRSRAESIQDAFTGNTALLTRMKKKGVIKPTSGGRSLVKELSYKANETVKRYSGYENLDIRPTQHLTAAEYTLKQMAVAVTMSGLEMLTNSGGDTVFDLLETRIENAEKSLIETLSADAYSDGTADGGKQMVGLQSLVSNTGQGIVGGIDSSTFTFWRNQFLSSTGAGFGTLSATTIQKCMNALYFNLCRGRMEPDLIVADNLTYRMYLESLQAIQRITQSNVDASIGFTSLKYMNADVVLDGGIGGDCPTNTMYMLNTSTLFYSPHKDRNMVPLNPTRYNTNQDAMIKLIAWAGAMGTTNRQFNGVIIA